MRLLLLSVACCLLACVAGQESACELMPPVEATLLKPGLRVAVPDTPGTSQVLIHYNINKPLPGVTAGDYFSLITQPTGGYWEYLEPDVEVVEGDTVNGWYQTIIDGQGRDCLEQSWIAVDDGATPGPTTIPTTTTTTPAPPTTTTTQGPTEPPTEPPTNPPGVSTDPPATPPPRPSDAGAQRAATYCDSYPCRVVPDPVEECESFPCLVFSDEFDFFDLHKWEHEITLGGGGNWEFQHYTNNRSNSYTRDGNLYLKPTLTEDKFGPGFLQSGTMDIWGTHPANLCTGNSWYGCMRVGNAENYLNPVASARVRSSNSFFFRYGRVETRARMPAGDWLWPAIWLLPRYEEYGMWPTSGEIDVLESRGNADLTNEDGKQMGNTHGGSTLHWGPFFEANRYEMTNEEFTGDLAANFHDYAIEWNKDVFIAEFDGQEIMRIDLPNGGFWELGGFEADFPGIDNPWSQGEKMAPFDTEFYIVMNVAVGGTMGFFPDTWTNGGYPKPWNNESPFAPRDFANSQNLWYPTWAPEVNNGENAAMVVDYVRVYKMSADDQ